MDITTPVSVAVLCILPYIAVVVIVAKYATRARLRFSERLRRGLQSGEYDPNKNPKRTMQIRAFLLVVLTLLTMIVALIVVAASFYIVPQFFAEAIGLRGLRIAIVSVLLLVMLATPVLNYVIGRIMGDGRG